MILFIENIVNTKLCALWVCIELGKEISLGMILTSVFGHFSFHQFLNLGNSKKP